MPIVRVLMYGGRSQQQKDDLARAITDAVENIAKAPRDQTIIVFQEVGEGALLYWSEESVLVQTSQLPRA